jgi:hypothetical protein
MIGDAPIITFDASAHNWLAQDKDVARSEAVLERLNSDHWFRFAGLSVEELFATQDSRERDALFTSCRNLQRGPSQSLLPSSLLITQMILQYVGDPANFNWKTVDVWWRDCDAAIRDPEFCLDDEISKKQHVFQKERKELARQQREHQRLSLRPEIQAIFKKHGELPPATFRPAISRLEKAEGGSVWAMAQGFYDRVSKTDSTDETMKEFMRVCPPFRSLVYAMFVPWYSNAVRDYHAGEKLNAGFNDLFMSVYLPYCDQFVTADAGQEKALRDAILGLGNCFGSRLLLFERSDLRDSFLNL